VIHSRQPHFGGSVARAKGHSDGVLNRVAQNVVCFEEIPGNGDLNVLRKGPSVL